MKIYNFFRNRLTTSFKLLFHKWNEKMKPSKYCSLGIDFGTHGTKIAYQQQDSQKVHLLNIQKNAEYYEGWDSNVFPSIITIDQQNLYFGQPLQSGHVIRNFKSFIGQNRIEPVTQFTYEELSVIYLGYVLQQSIQVIQTLEKEYDCKIMFQLGFPGLLTVENSIKNSYEKILRDIWRLQWKNILIEQGISIQEIKMILYKLQHLKIGIEDPIEIRQEENWRWLIPEIQASLAALSQDQSLPERSFHILIDIGGYTTDVGIFTVGRNQGNDRVATVFAWDVIYRAVNEFDQLSNERVLEWINRLRLDIVRVIRLPIDHQLLNFSFIHSDKKMIWKFGGGSNFRPEMVELIFDEQHFLPGYNNIERNPEIKKEDIIYLVVKGLSLRHDRMVETINAKRLLNNQFSGNDQILPYELQDVG